MLVIELVQRAAARRARTESLAVRRGVSSLATISTMAVCWGTAGTCYEVLSALHALRSAVFLAGFFDHLYQAILVSSSGMLIATVASVGHGAMMTQVETLEAEMALEIDQLPAALARMRR